MVSLNCSQCLCYGSVNVKASHEGRVFDERSVSFAVGEAADHGLPEGIDVAIRKFKKGEKSRLKLAPEYGFGADGSEEYGVPPDATVTYEVSYHPAITATACHTTSPHPLPQPMLIYIHSR